MDFDKTVRSWKSNRSLLSLMAGAPGPETLKDCREIILTATNFVLEEEANITSTFAYGDDFGDEEFRSQLATFLTEQYGDKVERSHLMATAGASQALHMIATVLFPAGSMAFVEDPTYFAASKMLRDDINMDVIPVPRDNEGIDTDALDRLLTEKRPKEVKLSEKQPFWTMVYMIPVYNNPTGQCYSADRCRKLIQLARKHDVLLVAEDIYNLIHFGDSLPPARLLSYDNPADPDYKGHVLSSGTFSKILAPGLRLGWVEAPEHILALLVGCNMMWSGGSLNHYVSKLASAAIKLGLQAKHLYNVRKIYKRKAEAVCKVLEENLPEGSTFNRPQGGFFVWVEFPADVDTFQLMQWMVDKHQMFSLPGRCTSLESKYGNCIRLSFCRFEESVLVKAMKTLCDGVKEFCSANKGQA